MEKAQQQAEKNSFEPNHTAVRVALWRALHVQKDPAPPVFDDEIGYQLIAPDPDWQERPDMDLNATQAIRASIVARARYAEDQVKQAVTDGIKQYVILGAGLDSFAQRKPDMAARLQIYEIDQTDTQNWKQNRLKTLGYSLPPSQHFVSVDFESGQFWWETLLQAGFRPDQPAIFACTGVSLYLTKSAIMATLRQFAGLAPGSTLAMTFNIPPESVASKDKSILKASVKGAQAGGTPFISFFSPEDITLLAKEMGLKSIQIVTAADLSQLYFKDRKDDFRPSIGEYFLVARI